MNNIIVQLFILEIMNVKILQPKSKRNFEFYNPVILENSNTV